MERTYRNNERIMIISGNNFLLGEQRQVLYSYYFSVYAYLGMGFMAKVILNYYDVEIQLWQLLKNSKSWLLQY